MAHPPEVIPIPIGSGPLTRLLETQPFPYTNDTRLLLMGLCGALDPALTIGDVALVQDCVAMDPARTVQTCDPTLSLRLTNQLPITHTVRLLTSDRILQDPATKTLARQTYGADIVDMEGSGLLKFWQHQDLAPAISMVRVVSDTAADTLPNMDAAIGDEGSLRTMPLLKSFLFKPQAAIQLLRGSTQALSRLETLAASL